MAPGTRTRSSPGRSTGYETAPRSAGVRSRTSALRRSARQGSGLPRRQGGRTRLLSPQTQATPSTLRPTRRSRRRQEHLPTPPLPLTVTILPRPKISVPFAPLPDPALGINFSRQKTSVGQPSVLLSVEGSLLGRVPQARVPSTSARLTLRPPPGPFPTGLYFTQTGRGRGFTTRNRPPLEMRSLHC